MKFKLTFTKGVYTGYLTNETGTHIFQCKSLLPKQIKILINGPTEDQVINIFNPEYAKLIVEEKEIDRNINTLVNTGKFELKNGSVYRKGIPYTIPKTLFDKYVENIEDAKVIKALDNFWLKCALNPSVDARENLHWFLEKWGFSITESGYFIGYRNVDVKNEGNKILHDFIVNEYMKIKRWKKSPNNYYILENNGEYSLQSILGLKDPDSKIQTLQYLYDNISDISETVYTDNYTKTFTIKIGEPVSMPREQCDFSQATCSRGLHIGGAGWLKKNYYGQQGLVCLINPMNVVSIPKEDNYGKLRCCEYLPIGIVEYEEGNIKAMDTTIFEFEYDDYTVEELTKLLLDIDSNNQVIHTLKNIPDNTSIFQNIEKYSKILEEKNIKLEPIKSSFSIQMDFIDDEDDEDDEDYGDFWDEYDEDEEDLWEQ